MESEMEDLINEQGMGQIEWRLLYKIRISVLGLPCGKVLVMRTITSRFPPARDLPSVSFHLDTFSVEARGGRK